MKNLNDYIINEGFKDSFINILKNFLVMEKFQIKN